MSIHRNTRITLAAVIFSAPLLAAAEHGGRFPNGEFLNGQPGSNTTNARVVDVATTRYANVNYGDTVVFSNGSKQFAWTFNGLDQRAVKLEQIAPHDFGATPFTVYVPQNPSHRN